MNFKFGVKQIVLIIVSVLLIGVLIAGNIVLDANSITLHKFFGGDKYDSEAGKEAYAMGDALVPQLVEDSAVLLRNENKALPLDSNKETEKKVNLFGWNATTKGFLLSGTGSGGSPVLEENRVTLAEAFEDAGYSYNKELYAKYETESGSTNTYINHVGQEAAASMAAIQNPGAEFYTDTLMTQARDYSDVAIIVLSRNTGENCGFGETLDLNNYRDGAWLELTANEKTMIEKVTQKFSDGKVIVLLNTTNTMELGFLEDYGVDAALYIGAVGQSGARAIPNLLYGQKTVEDEDGTKTVVKVNPSGKTADTYAYDYNLINGKSYSASWSSLLTRDSDKSLYYQEGIYVGYKWYETADAEGFFDGLETKYGKGYDGLIQYPFGYGLSYTDFRWTVEEWPSANKLTEKGEYEVKVRVKNVGNYPGKDVVELYYTPPYIDGGIEKAETNLLAFAKTATLDPGTSQLMTLKFTAYDLASYDDYDKNNNDFCGYELDKGAHVLKLRTDAHTDAVCYDENFEKTASSTFELSCDGVKFAKDPKTGTDVGNLFTGNTAYSGTPIDGSTAFNGGINYLSRANHFANFPKETTFVCKAPNTSPSKEFKTTAWDNADISNIEYGVDSGMYLLTKENGQKATLAELKSSTSNLVYNTDLMEELWKYDSPEWDDFLNELTQNEIKDLIGLGKFQTVAVANVGKPFCNEYDGPAGFNQNSSGTKSNPKWVVFPVEGILGCSWNPQSTYNMGKAMGFIGGETGVHGWYGPGLNIHRSPYYGRNFEYYSEDAMLSGKLTAECIRGAKENNLTCYMKHFACADIGQNSGNWYTWLTEQTLREIYLKPFEIAVKEGGANAVMSGFSAVGATWAGSNYALSTQILRNEWGFRGSMITDWENGYMDKIRGILGGNDLWLGQSGTNINFNNRAEAYCARQSAKNILYTYVDCYMTARTYQLNPDANDPYQVNIDKPLVGTASYSPLFVAMWVILDILLVLGFATCVLFIFVSPAQIAQLFKGKKASANGTPAPEETPVENTPPEEPEN